MIENAIQCLKYDINKVIVSTYQSASGAGQKGLDELNNGENKAFVAVYTDSSQSDISHLVFKDKLDSNE